MLPAGIARELHIDEETVKTHARRAIEKLGASTRTEAVLIHSRVHRTCNR
jgi:DNA-binding NarL/FixJ family response regulator